MTAGERAPAAPGPVGDPLPRKPPTGLVLDRARTGCGSNPAPAREVREDAVVKSGRGLGPFEKTIERMSARA